MIMKCTLCQGQFKKTRRHPKDDFCIEQESSFLSPIDVCNCYNKSYIALFPSLNLQMYYMPLSELDL